MSVEGRLMSPKDTAKFLGIDACALKKLTAKAGGPPSVTTKSGWVMYPQEALFEWRDRVARICEALSIAGTDRPGVK